MEIGDGHLPRGVLGGLLHGGGGIDLMTKRSIIASQRDSKLNFDLLESEAGAAELFVDGFTGLTFSTSIIKVDLFSTVGAEFKDDQVIEQRELKLRLVMPTNNFLDMCQKALESAVRNEDALNNSIKNYGEQLRKFATVLKTSDLKKEK